MREFRYRADIDGLRAVAVSLVLLFHGGLGFEGGYIGVDVFFVISGFLITGLVMKELDAGQFRLSTFWARRVRRILPASTVMTVVTLLVGAILLLPIDYSHLSKSAIAQQLMLSNVYFWRHSGYFDGSAELKPLLHTWSLAVEEQFYLGYPFLLILLHRLSTRSRVLILTGISVASFAVSELGVRYFPSATFYLLPARAWELIFGGLICFMPPPTRLLKWQANLLSVAGLTGVMVAACLFNSGTRFPGTAALLPCLGAALLIYSNSLQLTSVGRLLASKPMVTVGLLSYSLYLWHWPVLVFMRYWLGSELSTVQGVIALASSNLLAYLSWRFVEGPLRKLRSGQSEMVPCVYAACSTFAIVTASLAVIMTSGFSNRFSKETLEIAKTDMPSSWTGTAVMADNGSLPVVGSKDGDQRPSLLFWGDSHLGSIVGLCDDLAREYNLSAVIAGHHGFPPLLDAWCVQRDNKELLEWNQAVRRYIRDHNISDVVLISRWSIYVDGRSNGERDMLLVDKQSDTDAPNFAVKALEASVQRTVESLQQDNVRVWIMKQVPEQTGNPTQKILFSKIFGIQLPVGTSSTNNHERHQNAERVIDALAASEVRILDPGPSCFDSDGNSIIFDGTRSLYFDDNHLSAHGARRLLRSTLEPLFAEVSKQLNPTVATLRLQD